LRAGRSWSRRPAITFGYHRVDGTERTAEKFVPASRGSPAEQAMLIFRAGAMGQIPEISVSLSQVCRFCGTRLTASVPMTSLRLQSSTSYQFVELKSVCSNIRKGADPDELLPRSTASRRRRYVESQPVGAVDIPRAGYRPTVREGQPLAVIATRTGIRTQAKRDQHFAAKVALGRSGQGGDATPCAHVAGFEIAHSRRDPIWHLKGVDVKEAAQFSIKGAAASDDGCLQ
jgi:hypothetical protein